MGNKIPLTGAALQDTTAFACLHDTNKSYETANQAYKDSKSKLTSLRALFNGYVFSSIKYAATGVVAGVQAVAFTALAAAAAAAQVPAFLLNTKQPWEVAKQYGDKAHASIIIIALSILGTFLSNRAVKAVNDAAEQTNKAVPYIAAESPTELNALADEKEKAIRERNQKDEVDAKEFRSFVATQFIAPAANHFEYSLKKFEYSKNAALAEVAKKQNTTIDKVDPNAAISKLYIQARGAIRDIQANQRLAEAYIKEVPTNAQAYAQFKIKHFIVQAKEDDAKTAIEKMKAEAEGKFQARVKEFETKKAELKPEDTTGHEKIANDKKALEAAKETFLSEFNKETIGLYNASFAQGVTVQPDVAAYQQTGRDIDTEYANFLGELKGLQNKFMPRLNNNFIVPIVQTPVSDQTANTNGTVTGASGNRATKAFFGMLEGTRNLLAGMRNRFSDFWVSEEAA